MARIAELKDYQNAKPAPDSVEAQFRAFAHRADTIPHAGELPENTWMRWQTFSKLAEIDLCLVKLVEAHADALGILHEFDVFVDPQTLWAVWAAEPPNLYLVAEFQNDRWYLTGTKAWCSGARLVTNALVTCRSKTGDSLLMHLPLAQRGVHIGPERWQGFGMRDIGTVDVEFQGAEATIVGPVGGYVNRPGFWFGAIGIAACWYGGAVAVAQKLRTRCATNQPDPHALAHLGAIDAALWGARAALLAAAYQMSRGCGELEVLANRTRGVVEAAATLTLDAVGRALGAGPLCADAAHSKRVADLTIFLRQSHAEKDLANLATNLSSVAPDWSL